jgi:hypothetical protein
MNTSKIQWYPEVLSQDPVGVWVVNNRLQDYPPFWARTSPPDFMVHNGFYAEYEDVEDLGVLDWKTPEQQPQEEEY